MEDPEGPFEFHKMEDFLEPSFYEFSILIYKIKSIFINKTFKMEYNNIL